MKAENLFFGGDPNEGEILIRMSPIPSTYCINVGCIVYTNER